MKLVQRYFFRQLLGPTFVATLALIPVPFVVAIALEYRRWGVPLEDVIQQGTLGLLRAAKKFDLAKVNLSDLAAMGARRC